MSTEDGKGNKVDQFCEKLQIVRDKLPKHNALIMLWGSKARLAKGSVHNNVWKVSLHEVTNISGLRLKQYASSNILKL